MHALNHLKIMKSRIISHPRRIRLRGKRNEVWILKQIKERLRLPRVVNRSRNRNLFRKPKVRRRKAWESSRYSSWSWRRIFRMIIWRKGNFWKEEQSNGQESQLIGDLTAVETLRKPEDLSRSIILRKAWKRWKWWAIPNAKSFS